MKHLKSFTSNQTTNFKDDSKEKKGDYYDKYSNNLIRTYTQPDYLKLISIIVLLTASIIMYNYEPAPVISRGMNYNQSLTETREIDDNPYGFHPFYQVHKRIRYKNPTTNPCQGIDPRKTLLLAILSRANNAHIREAIRRTWGAIRVYNGIEIRTTFLVAVDDGMLKQIEIEQTIYHDVIQVNLPENYPVVSYKELATLCWSRYFCPNIQYIFKADEDIHLNTPLLTRIIAQLTKNETIPNIPIMYGWFRRRSRVDRNGRYLVTEEEYPGFYYPPYTFGIGYLLTKTGRDQLCVAAQRPHPVTRVGDAYITGILRDHAQVQYARFDDIHYIYSYALNGMLCQGYFTYDPKLLICMSSVHSGINNAAAEYVHVWNAIYKDPKAPRKKQNDDEKDDEEDPEEKEG